MTVRVWSMSAIVCALDVRQAIQGQPTLTSEPIALELNVDLGLERVTELEDEGLWRIWLGDPYGQPFPIVLQ